MLDENKVKVTTNLKKARGQIALIQKMVDNGQYCVDIAQHVNAAIGLLKKANNYILENHLLTCGAKKLNSSKSSERMAFTQELIKAFTITTK